MADTPSLPPPSHWWNNERNRGLLYQVALISGVLGLGWFLVANTLSNLDHRHIATGFGFLSREAGFGISEHLIDYSPADNYLHALLVGLLNTIEVSVAGIVLTTLLGIVMGIARLSPNWLVARLATVYVEAVRNVPLLLQLFFWYALITQILPGPRQAFHPMAGVFLSNRGLRLPTLVLDGAGSLVVGAALLALVLWFGLSRWSKVRRERTGQPFPVVAVGLGLLVALPLLGYVLGGADLHFDVPELKGFNFAGGATLTPEFVALLLGLVVYTGGFIAEIVRGGIQAVPWGQTEAALSLGLSRGQTLRLVLLPQALRVIVPPLTSQYLNLTKNSTLAVAIGFPDLVSVGNTAINQTGQAVEGVAIIMAVYLTISLALSALMNAYNKRILLQGGR